MVGGHLKIVMAEVNGNHKLDDNDGDGEEGDADDDDGNNDKSEKMKTSENKFSVERLLALNENRKTVGREKEQQRGRTDLDHKVEEKEKQTQHTSTKLDLSIGEFEMLPNGEFQNPNLEQFERLEEQIQASESAILTKDKIEKSTDVSNISTQSVKVSNNRDNLNTNSNVKNLTVEFHDLRPKSLKVSDKMNYDSDDSQELNDTSLYLGLDTDVLDSKENLMRFAEVLYKCTLCTSIPSILTSKESFTKHITEQHLTHQQNYVDCPHCLLKFQTDEDLKEHRQLTHNTGSDITDSSELQDFEAENVISYDLDPLDRDDSDSHSSGHRSSSFVLAHSEENEHFSGAMINKDGVTTCNGSLDLTLKNGHNINKNFKQEKLTSIGKPNKNLPLLHQITDQIVKSSTPDRNKYENIRPFGFTPSYTPEFGKYTKLVREGGNIVYFCQVCNWKSPVKATFSVHCGIADHKRKVIMAERSEKGNANEIDITKLSPSLSNETKSRKLQSYNASLKTISQNKEPVGWNPRGGASCLSLLSEPSGFYMGSKTGPFKSRNEFYPYKRLEEKAYSSHRKKKTLMNSVRHQMRLKPRWSDTDSDDDYDDDNDGLNKSPLLKNSENHKAIPAKDSEKQTEEQGVNKTNIFQCNKEADFLSYKSTKDASSDINSVTIKKENTDKDTDSVHDKTRPFSHIHEDLGEPIEKKQKMSPHSETSIQNLIDKHVVENIKHKPETSVIKPYKCHLCVFEYSDLSEFGKHFEEVHKSLGSPEKLDVDVPQRKHNDSSRTGTPNVELGENWRVQKLKDLLPGKC